MRRLRLRAAPNGVARLFYDHTARDWREPPDSIRLLAKAALRVTSRTKNGTTALTSGTWQSQFICFTIVVENDVTGRMVSVSKIGDELLRLRAVQDHAVVVEVQGITHLETKQAFRWAATSLSTRVALPPFSHRSCAQES